MVAELSMEADVMWLAEPVTGHRAWKLEPDPMMLRGAYGVWQSGFLEAQCIQFEHDSPHWPEPIPKPVSDEEWSYYLSQSADPRRCYCGINAYKLHVMPDQLVPIKDTSGAAWFDVMGVVDLGGRVHEYDYGYRAQYARIIEATIVTRIPFGGNFTSYLSDKYEAPFRAMTLTEWKQEWELTYGTDRESEEEDSDTSTGAETVHPTGGTIPQGAITQRTTTRSTWGVQVTAQRLTNRGKVRWQPRLSDGRTMWKYGRLPPEFIDCPLSGHRRVVFRSEARADRVARRLLRKEERSSQNRWTPNGG